MAIERAAFIARITESLYKGRLRTSQPLTREQAQVRAIQVADALPGLFTPDDVELSCAA